MNAKSHAISEPRELARLLVVYWRRWAIPAAIVTTLAAGYATIAPKTWQASQAMIVRNEASIGESSPGKFHGPEDLKTIQETIVEISKSRGVMQAALQEIGPPTNDTSTAAWPSDKQLAEVQKVVKIVPPKGVEFGTSEVFYLEVRDNDRKRVAALCTALCRQLQIHLQDIRNAKAESMTDELSKSVQVAKSDLQAATKQLTALEKEVGSDLSELRSLLDSNSSDTSLRRTVSEIENELRQVRATSKGNRQMLEILRDAETDPSRLVAAPNRLLEAQPALRRLKDGLVDAQIRTATLQGKMSADHPEVLSAKESESQVAQRLHNELATAIRSIEGESRLDDNRIDLLERQQKNASQRLTRLAGLRAVYANILAETNHRARLLEHAEQALTDARSSSASARAASLIAMVDAPDTGSGPVSPTRTAILLGGLLGGLVTGFGVVLLTVPATVPATVKKEPAMEAVAIVPMKSPAAATLPGTALIAYSISSLDKVVHPSRSLEPWSMPAGAGDRGLSFKQALMVLNERGQLQGTNPS